MIQISVVRWVTLDKAAELTGYSEKALRHKISLGIWAEGVQWKWADDNRMLVNLEEYDKWVDHSTSKGCTRGKKQSLSTCAA